MSASENSGGAAATTVGGALDDRDAKNHGRESVPLALAPGGAWIENLTKLLALGGGILLLFAILLTLASVGGRYILGMPVPGDYELVEISCGVAVFLFFPFTHAMGGNITAEFFTSGLPQKSRRSLDTLHDAVFFLLGALMTWRLTHGFLEKLESGETSILIGLPLWWGYAVGVFSLALLTLVCLLRVFAGVALLRRKSPA